ncbi:MAG: hypothetical protein WD342_19735 [Verrucomicrobiales bacterium]
MKSRIRWVVALRPEATPLIERFSLALVRKESGMFPVYASPERDTELIVSGPGKTAAAAATAYLAAGDGSADLVSGWINFGVAGCGGASYGTAFLGGKITDESTGRSWYPPAIGPGNVEPPRVEILTVDRPTDRYPPGGALVEMEASGFYPIALRAASAELCQAVKVVSDDPAHSVKDVDKRRVTEICGEAVDTVMPWCRAFRETVEAEAARLADPPGYAELLNRLRFSETQRHQLRRLLQQWASRHPGRDAGAEMSLEESREAKACLNSLRKKLWESDGPDARRRRESGETG